ncbi:NB-ARC domain-containing protein [Microseira wollei]|uniref:Transcriptional regulator, LuxR family protein n=1 Tax=Microseira wollei NIES-4236 TaxID=2530354 RepID=A0AAV3X6W9_9CYAN|nr:NB-ARC domain-containing protein [Microseira wollei]GET37878.1 transcriptional regulator, LuxR family protein [Microseira wollei NIES-4236]
MISQIPQGELEAIVAAKGVSEAEWQTLSLALKDLAIAEIAAQLEISEVTVRKRLGEVFKKFKLGGVRPGKLTDLKQILLSESQKRQSALPGKIVWGEAPDVSTFYGRSDELDKLAGWIVEEKCRLVALLGLRGMGKTALCVKLVKQVSNDFDRVIWRSLRYAPPLDDLLANLIPLLSHPQKPNLPTETNQKISLLIECFRQHRCLIVLDCADAILQTEELAGRYQKGYEKYGELFRRVGEERHQSCLLITSIENFPEIAALEEKTSPVRTFTLTNLNLSESEIRDFFNKKGLFEDENRWSELIGIYRGNPLALKMAVSMIKDLFGGRVSTFLDQKTFVVGDISSLVKQQFERLSKLEEKIVNVLAKEEEPISFVKLRQKLSSSDRKPPELSELMAAMQSLTRRSLLETKDTNTKEVLFTLQSLVKEYARTQLPSQPTSADD